MFNALCRLLQRTFARPPSIGTLAWSSVIGMTGIGCTRYVSEMAEVPTWIWMVLAFVAGAATSAAAFWIIVGLPLAASGRTAQNIESGDLSETFPSSGPANLKILHRLLNTLLADFQEVLLLFAQLTCEAMRELDGQETRPESAPGDQARCLAIRRNLVQMRSVVESFTFFGVQIRGNTISDVNIERSLRSDSVAGGGSFNGPPSGTEKASRGARERDAHHE